MFEWIDNINKSPGKKYIAVDAAGETIDGVVRARETQNGIEVVRVQTAEHGGQLVYSENDGVDYEPVVATCEIPGGMLIDITNDDDEVE